MAPTFVHRGMMNLIWVIRHYRLQGTDTTTWKLYAGSKLYRGPAIFDASYLAAGGYTSSPIVTDSDDPAFTSGSLFLFNTRAPDNLVYLLLTATNGDTSTYSCVTQLDVFARP
jgi:hypothetical protein